MRFSLLADELSLSSFKDKNDGLELLEVEFAFALEVELEFIALWVELVLVVVVEDEEADVFTWCCGWIFLRDLGASFVLKKVVYF